MALELALNVALNLATTALLAYAGVLVGQRSLPDASARIALRLFSVWWYSVAAVVLLAGSHTLLAIVGITSPTLHQAITYLTALPLALGLWGLLYYLIFIYTGRASALWPLTIGYLFFLAFELYYFSSFGGTRHLEETPWQFRFVGDTMPDKWISITFGILLAVPILFVVIAYAGLYRSTRDPSVRSRISMISLAFGLWFRDVLLAFLLGWDRAEWFPVAYEAPGLVAGVLIVLAYRRPRGRSRAVEKAGAG